MLTLPNTLGFTKKRNTPKKKVEVKYEDRLDSFPSNANK